MENTFNVVHVAGPPINVLGRVLQRCIVCGDRLVDSGNEKVAINQKYPCWTPMSFVRMVYNADGSVTATMLGSCVVETAVPPELCFSLGAVEL